MKRLALTKRDLGNFALIAFVVFLILLAMFLVTRFSARPQMSVQLGNQTFHVAVVRSDSELERGLSGTDYLAENRGMLFVFSSDDTWAIWMKDMRYPIDVIWLDRDKHVVAIEKNMQPSSYPNSYASRTLARYVLEVPAGAVDRAGITVDKTAVFSDNNT